MITASQIERLLAPVVLTETKNTSDQRADIIVTYLKRHTEASVQDFCKTLGASDSLVNRVVRQLIEDGVVDTEIIKHQYRNSVGGTTTATRRIFRLAK